MIPLRGITTCVGYSDLLRITLPLNLRHFTECVVVTSPDDAATIELCRSFPSVNVHITDAFTRHGARFNKGLGMEEGFDVLGRHGWILIWDADIIMPDQFPYSAIKDDHLHGCRRRLCNDPDDWSPGVTWGRFRLVRDGGPVGFFQLFNAADPAIKDRRPWYDVSFAHAGGGDAYFLNHWPLFKRTTISMDVLHLGPCDTNWFGTDEEGRKIMRAFVLRNGWRAARTVNPDEVKAVGEIVERVEVPDFPPSSYELPFTIRAREIEEQKKRAQQAVARHHWQGS